MGVHFGLALDFWNTTKPVVKLLDDYSKLLNLAERYGFESVWAGENRPSTPVPGHVPSPLVILSALAHRTQLRLGTGVLLLPLWHPLQLTYDAAMLDHLSEGRLVLGVGVGSPTLMERYGIPPEETATRMDEALILLKKLWAGADEFHGQHFNVNGHVYPGPFQSGGPPLWVGGKIRRSVERAAAYGDGWYGATQYHFELIKKQTSYYRELLTAHGKDANKALIAINRTTFLAGTDEEARREGKPYVNHVLKAYARFGALRNGQGTAFDPADDLFEQIGDELHFTGGPDRCKESIQRYAAAGVTHFNLRISPANMPLELAQRTVQLLGEQVLPHFQS